MADLPELQADRERSLAVRWDHLRDKHNFIGEHLHWYDKAAARERSIAGRLGQGLRSLDYIGLDRSVKFAEAWFNALAEEYWVVWRRSSQGYEVFGDWLDEIKRKVTEDITSLWKGGSVPVADWHKRVCEPSVEKKLKDLVRECVGKARAEELKRIERVREPNIRHDVLLGALRNGTNLSEVIFEKNSQVADSVRSGNHAHVPAPDQSLSVASRATQTPAQIETKEQRSLRRRLVVDPWLLAAGIPSPEDWASKAGNNMDKNTPRDYLNGTTKKLRSSTREALARPLNKTPAGLPD